MRRLGLYIALLLVGPAMLSGDVSPALRIAAERGDKTAQCTLGLDYLDGGDAENAGRWLREAAEQGDVAAQTSLGDALMRGDVLPRNLQEAEKWLQIASNQGDDAIAKRHLIALRAMLGKSQLEAPPSENDDLRAAQRGDAEAQYRTALYCFGRNDAGGEMTWLKRAANAGHPRAQAQIGHMFLYGIRGAPKDPAVAETWLRKAVAGGDIEGHVTLATLLLMGGTTARDAEAFRLVQHAAKDGSPSGAHLLGILYCRGRGVPEDLVSGVAWLTLAAASEPDAGKKRDECIAAMSAAEIAAAEVLSGQLADQIKARR